MGLFDFFKRKKHEKEVKVTYSGRTFIAPKAMSSEEYQRHRQTEIDTLERQYDLSTVEGINSIPVPKFKAKPAPGISSPTGKIEYYLMIKAGQYEKTDEVELALACYRKANELMPMSSTEYGREPYMRLSRYLRRLRRFDEARAEEAKISQLFASGLVFDYGEDAPDVARRREEYDWLWEYLPDLCPKSLSAYSRIKNQKAEKYQPIIAEAKKLGYIIE